MVRMYRGWVMAVCALAALGAATAGRSADVPPAPVTVVTPAKAAPAADDNVVTFDAGYTKWLNQPHTVEMSKGVQFVQGDSTLKTDSAIVYLDSSYHASTAKSLAAVHLYDPSNDLNADIGTIDFVHHTATLHGHVVLVTKREIPGETDTAPATVTCDDITYDYRNKTGAIPGAITVKQTDRTLYADSGVYNTAQQTITLTGNVHGHDAKGNELSGPQAVVDITPGHEAVTLQGPIHGSFPVSDEDNSNSTSKSK